MVTDTERREVARRLRELDYAHFQESLICAYLDALGIEGYEDWEGIAHRLADLIMPSRNQETAEKTFGHMRHSTKEERDEYTSMLENMSVELHPVDRDALLALADEIERKASNWDATQGDVPLVHAGYLMGYADRIREALGDCQRGVSGVGDRGVSRGPSGQVGGRAQGSTRADRGEKE